MKSVREALDEITRAFKPLGLVQKPLLDALGDVLGCDVASGVALPPFDNSAMDGYAFQHADLPTSASAPASLPVVGESRAGGPPPAPLSPASAMRIFTGAALPEHADTVVIQENVTRRDGRIELASVPERGANVRKRGSDLRAGARALRAGIRLGPGEVALLAALGRPSVAVHRRPRVAIVATGDELRDIGQAREPGTIVNTNAYALAAQVKQAGGVPWVMPIARDVLDDIHARLREALRADVVLSIGGVSVGDYDLVGRAFEEAGITRHLWKVAIKPGKPLMFASKDGVPVIGLPGNPVSAMVTFEVFVRPGLLRMRGFSAAFPVAVQVELEHDHHHRTGRTEFARAELLRRESGLCARLCRSQGSGSLLSMCGVDALVILDAEREHFPSGTRLPALLLADTQYAESPGPWSAI